MVASPPTTIPHCPPACSTWAATWPAVTAQWQFRLCSSTHVPIAFFPFPSVSSSATTPVCSKRRRTCSFIRTSNPSTTALRLPYRPCSRRPRWGRLVTVQGLMPSAPSSALCLLVRAKREVAPYRTGGTDWRHRALVTQRLLPLRGELVQNPIVLACQRSATSNVSISGGSTSIRPRVSRFSAGNPCRSVRHYKEHARERFLTPDEYRRS